MKTTPKFILTFLILTSTNLVAQSWTLRSKNYANSRTTNSIFGAKTVINGNYAFVSSQNDGLNSTDSNPITNAGSVTIFKKNNSNWNFHQKITANDREANALFGISLSVDGNYAAIGSQSATDSNLLNNQQWAGAVYIFELKSNGRWTQIKKISARDRFSNDRFGNSVYLKGRLLAIGSPYNDLDENGANNLQQAGAVYLYNINSGVIRFNKKIVPTDRAGGDEFGTSIVHNGLDKIIVGSPESIVRPPGLTPRRGGSVYYFNKNTSGTIIEVQKIIASDLGFGDLFGGAVALSDSSLIIGSRQNGSDSLSANFITNAGSVYTYNLSSGLTPWVFNQKITANRRIEESLFGNSLDIENNTLVIGSRKDDPYNSYSTTSPTFGAGSVSVFKKNSLGKWTFDTKLVSNDSLGCIMNDWFGASVSINNNNISIGAYKDGNILSTCPDDTATNAGSVYFFGLNYLSQKELSKEIKLTLYPNPTNDKISLLENEMDISSINVFNYQGKFMKSFYNGFNSMDVSELNTGLYFFRINTPQKSIVNKIIKL